MVGNVFERAYRMFFMLISLVIAFVSCAEEAMVEISKAGFESSVNYLLSRGETQPGVLADTKSVKAAGLFLSSRKGFTLSSRAYYGDEPKSHPNVYEDIRATVTPVWTVQENGSGKDFAFLQNSIGDDNYTQYIRSVYVLYCLDSYSTHDEAGNFPLAEKWQGKWNKEDPSDDDGSYATLYSGDGYWHTSFDQTIYSGLYDFLIFIRDHFDDGDVNNSGRYVEWTVYEHEKAEYNAELGRTVSVPVLEFDSDGGDDEVAIIRRVHFDSKGRIARIEDSRGFYMQNISISYDKESFSWSDSNFSAGYPEKKTSI